MQSHRKYRVTAFYDRPPVERNVVIEAESPERAILKALLERKIPVEFGKDEFGWVTPRFWSPDMGGERRWPTLLRNKGYRAEWGQGNSRKSLRIAAEEIG